MRVRCRAVRWVDHLNPGAIEAYLADCDGFEWQVVAKYVYFIEWNDLGPDTEFPREVTIPCVVQREDGECVSIALNAFTEGPFEVPRSALLDDSN